MQLKSVQFLNKKAILFFLLFSFALTLNVSAQEQKMPDDIFVEMACFKAKKPGASKMFKEMGKPFHEEMIKQGILIDWAFFTVDYPNGADCDCDFREIRVFRDMESLDKLNSNEVGMGIAMKLWPEMDMQKTMQDFRETVEFKHSEIYHLMDEVVPGPVKSDMAVVNFMNVKDGQSANYVKMEQEVFKPMHKENNKSGKLKDWIMAERVLPYGKNFETDYITVDVYDNYSDFNATNYMDLFKKVHPDKDAAATMKKMNSIRDLTKAEIWKKITEADLSSIKPTEATSGK